MGVSEFENFKKGTESIANVIAKSNAFSVIGGGDSAAAAIKLGFADKFNHISTGGGASLKMLEGRGLVGIEAIQNIGDSTGDKSILDTDILGIKK
jgi:phosphoglycerate kinase